ncbi:hypothetical protein ACHWQZ_G014716 [Mnemiopsis leidyi]
MDNLRKKGLRAYFSLRNLVDIKALSVHALLKLFDALILPVISYGSQIWFHKTAFMTQVLNQNMENKPHEALKKIVTDPIERLHLKFLKWTLGVHEKTSNIFCWGDTADIRTDYTLNEHATMSQPFKPQLPKPTKWSKCQDPSSTGL